MINRADSRTHHTEDSDAFAATVLPGPQGAWRPGRVSVQLVRGHEDEHTEDGGRGNQTQLNTTWDTRADQEPQRLYSLSDTGYPETQNYVDALYALQMGQRALCATPGRALTYRVHLVCHPGSLGYV